MIWPFSKIKRVEKENLQLRETIQSLKMMNEDLIQKNEQLKKYLVQSAEVLKKKQEDYELTIAFLKLKDLPNKK